MQYTEYELQLEEGSKLFVYTDGLPEAASEEDGFFGMERMLDAVSAAGTSSPRQILDSITETVDDFVGDSEQFDDLTMLCLEYKGRTGK